MSAEHRQRRPGSALVATAVAVPTALFVLAAVLMAIPSGGVSGIASLPSAGAQVVAFDPRQLHPEPLFASWGVTGRADNVHAGQAGCPADLWCAGWTGPQPNVWDFAEVGDRIYVAGIFTGVRRNAFYWPDDPVRDQPFLAAFDRTTGEFVASFAPDLNGPVYEITALPNGTLLAAGEFTEVNGLARVGLVALDAVTGATAATFTASIAAPGSPEPAHVKKVLVDGSKVYVAGSFSRLLDGTDGSNNFVWNVVRLDAATGALDRTWSPRAAGSVWDLVPDPARNRVHLVGYFTSLDALPDTTRMGTVSMTDGRAVSGLVQYAFNHEWNNDTVAVTSAGNRTWVAGGNHLIGVLDPTTNARLRTIDDQTFPASTGDLQTIETFGAFVLAGHHGAGNGTVWAFDATTTNIVSWSPNLSRNVYGTWALHVDADGCLWSGGDHHRTTTGRWLGGFARFCPRTQNLAQGKVATASSEAIDGVAARAVDGNVDGRWSSGSTTHTASQAQPWWQVDLGASVSIGSIELFNRTDCCSERLTGVWVLTSDVPITGTTLDAARAQPGVRATNLGGPLGLLGTAQRFDVNARYVRVQLQGTGFLSLAEVRVWRGRPADTSPPSTPAQVTATSEAAGAVSLAWAASTDNVGVRGYLVHRNWQFLAWVPAGTTYRDATAVAGQTYRYEVRAQDAAGNNSPPSTPVTLRAGPLDTQAPSTPANVVTTPGAASVTITWEPATDDVGVRGYLVHRDWQFLAWVPTGTTFTDVNLTPGQTYGYQVRAQDAAGNNSLPSTITPAVPA